MPDESPRPSPRRPATARRREGGNRHVMSPPTPEEMDAIERHHAAVLRYGGAEVVDDPAMGVVWVRFAHGTPRITVAKCVRWPDDSVSERLDTLAERMRADGEWPAVSTAEGVTRPAGLDADLARRGWHKVDGERIMFTRHAPVVPHLDPGLRIEAVTPATAGELARLEAANFGLPGGDAEQREQRLTEAVSASALRGFLVRVVGETVASARLVPGPGIAGLSGVGVRSEHRGRGYARLVTAVATRAGLATGHKLVWLSVDESNAPALHVYAGLGYRPTFAWSRWIAPAT